MGGLLVAESEAKLGLKAAVEGVVDTSEGPFSPACQLPLLPADQLDGLPEARGERVVALQAPRRAGPGRPPGAKNRSTTEWQRYLLAKYRSPLEALAEIMSRPVSDLVDEVGCTRFEALKLQVHAAAELAPYLHGKMPVEVQMHGDLPIFNLVLPQALAQAGDASRTFDLSTLEIIENQGLAEGATSGVGQPELDSKQKSEDDQ
jgi:hypothetical protein